LKIRGQGAFEYILMLSGVILVVVLIMLILQGSVVNANSTLSGNQNKFANNVDIQFISHRTPNLYVADVTGGVNNTPCCANQAVAGARCEGAGGASTTTACTPAAISCSSKYFNNATGECG